MIANLTERVANLKSGRKTDFFEKAVFDLSKCEKKERKTNRIFLIIILQKGEFKLYVKSEN